MEVAAEDSADLEKVDSEETTPNDGRKKNLALKLQRMKMRGLGMQRSYTPSSINMAAVYELRLKKLRRNNRSLAKALADQKIETQQWYSEVVSLKGQLQEANERLLRPLDNNSENLIEQEVDRRIKEIGEPLNAAISQAMENLLVVVENFSKVKQVANIRSSLSRMSSSSSFSFPRSSGSRAPLGSCGNPSSPCQSVRPMVSGHVLQPAMVAIQKLDDVWKARLKERIQEREGEEMNMSTIGENSVASAGEENEFISQNDTLSTSQQITEDPSSNVSESATESLSPKSPGRGGQSRRGRSSLENRREPFKSPVDRNNLPVSSASPVMSKTGEGSNEVSNFAHLEHIEDPLEGPSWWYADSASGRGRGRGRSRGRGRGRKRGHSRCDHGSPVTSVNCSIEASSESEEEESFRKRSKSHIHEDVKINNDSPVLSDVSKQILEHSYLDSPKSMLTKLENLEAKSGRRSKSKSKSKGRSLRISEAIPDNVQNQHQQHNFAGIGKDAIVAHNDDKVTKANGSSSLDNKSQSHIDPRTLEDPVNIPESVGRDFFIRDSDLTCIGDISMDITEPISKILSQATAENKKEESKVDVNNTENKKDDSKEDVNKNNEKKFFKNDTTSCLQKTSETGKTPFDLSLMDDTYITIPPYSSQKNIEKENMPPDSSRSALKNDDDENYDLNLRRVSVVLNDIMKSSESVNMMPDGTMISPAAEDELNSNETTTMNKRNSTLINNKHNSRSKKNLCFSLKTLDLEGEEDKDTSWTPDKKKRKSTNRKTRKSSNSKKNDSEPLSVPKKQTKRKAKSELIVPTNAKICEVVEKEVEKSVCRTSNETNVNEEFDSIDDNDPKTLINDCYVKICRTPFKEVRKTIASVDDTCFLIEEDSLPDFGLLYRKMSTQNTTPVSWDSSCTKSEKKMELTEKVPVDCGVLGTTIEACQDLEPDQAEDSGPDHIVPDEGRVACLETGSDNGETMNLSDPVIAEEANDLPPIDTSERIDITKDKTDSDIVEVEAPRKRRAALKIASFKEPNLHKKMRRGGETSNIGTSVPSKARSNTRSGRKSSCS